MLLVYRSRFQPDRRRGQSRLGIFGGRGAHSQLRCRMRRTDRAIAEAIEITYDPDKVSYGQLFENLFQAAWRTIPRSLTGRETIAERISIGYLLLRSRAAARAEAYIQQLDRAKVFRSPIVTEVTPLDGFLSGRRVPPELLQSEPARNPYVAASGGAESGEDHASSTPKCLRSSRGPALDRVTAVSAMEICCIAARLSICS